MQNRTGFFNGYKVHPRTNNRILSSALTFFLITSSFVGCVKEKDELTNEEVQTEEVINQADINKNPDGELEIFDAYMNYFESKEPSVADATQASISGLLDKYDELKENFDESGFKENAIEEYNKQKKEFLYSLNVLSNEINKILNEDNSIMSYDEYKEDYEQTITVREKAAKSVNRINNVFEGINGIRNKIPEGIFDNIYNEYLNLKETYELYLSNPELTNEEITNKTNEYIMACKNLLRILSEKLAERGININEIGNQLGGRQLIKEKKD